MSSRDFMRQFDAQVIGAFAAAGLADAATYTAPGGTPVPVSVLVDRDIQQWGEGVMPVAAFDVAISLQLAQVSPRAGGVVHVDGEAWKLETKLSDDGSLQKWGVVRG